MKYSNIQLILLSILAGIFISIGATAYLQSLKVLPNTYSKLIGSIFFSIGLILIIITKAELFTGNNLLIVGLLNKTISIKQLIKNWIIVYIGNFLGTIMFSIIIRFSNMNLPIEKIIVTKCSKSFIELFILGILCNILVCLAVWMCNNISTITDKILMIVFPISIFVFCGFEHSIADMFYLLLNYLMNSNINNLIAFRILLPVTIGNIIGGTFIGLLYWLSFKNNKIN